MTLWDDCEMYSFHPPFLCWQALFFNTSQQGLCPDSYLLAPSDVRLDSQGQGPVALWGVAACGCGCCRCGCWCCCCCYTAKQILPFVPLALLTKGMTGQIPFILEDDLCTQQTTTWPTLVKLTRNWVQLELHRFWSNLISQPKILRQGWECVDLKNKKRISCIGSFGLATFVRWRFSVLSSFGFLWDVTSHLWCDLHVCLQHRHCHPDVYPQNRRYHCWTIFMTPSFDIILHSVSPT